jgi:adenine-specific DNA-methyltransferase
MIAEANIKKTGATFTPMALADYLAEKLLEYSNFEEAPQVLDPACGEGALLMAMGKVLRKNALDFNLTGYDTNQNYLATARNNTSIFGLNKTRFVQGDFLESVALSRGQLSLNFEIANQKTLVNHFADVIIANPPYVRTQILGAEQAQKLATKFNLQGRVDLYYPFIIAMTESLKAGGLLGVITSNRYLTTKSGESVRKYLSEHYDIIELIDLGDTKIFDAAVLPAIFIGRKREKVRKPIVHPKFFKIYEDLTMSKVSAKEVGNVFEALNSPVSGHFLINSRYYKKTTGILKPDSFTGKPWAMFAGEEEEWVSEINRNSDQRIGDLFKVRVGIKTTADKVFISDQWENLGEDQPENYLLKDLISQENLEPWNLNDKIKLRVLYPHFSIAGKKQTIDIDQYPKAKRYFLQHEEQLKSRKYLIEAGRKWFEIWVPQHPAMWAKPKLVFPDISSIPRFYFDNSGKIVNGNCYWISADNEKGVEMLLLIQGVANSKLMAHYHDLVFNNRLYSGKRRYFSQFVEKYPVPKFGTKTSFDIIKISKDLNNNPSVNTRIKLQSDLEIKVAEAFGIQPKFNLD